MRTSSDPVRHAGELICLAAGPDETHPARSVTGPCTVHAFGLLQAPRKPGQSRGRRLHRSPTKWTRATAPHRVLNSQAIGSLVRISPREPAARGASSGNPGRNAMSQPRDMSPAAEVSLAVMPSAYLQAGVDDRAIDIARHGVPDLAGDHRNHGTQRAGPDLHEPDPASTERGTGNAPPSANKSASPKRPPSWAAGGAAASAHA